MIKMGSTPVAFATGYRCGILGPRGKAHGLDPGSKILAGCQAWEGGSQHGETLLRVPVSLSP